MIAARTFLHLSLVTLVLASTLSTSAVASPARRLARQGVFVVAVPTIAPAPAVVMPLPGALPVVASPPLRPWRRSLVQPVALVVPVPGVPLAPGPAPAFPPSHEPVLVEPRSSEPDHLVEPGLVAPTLEPATPPVTPSRPIPQPQSAPAAAEQIPAPPAAAAEPELRFGNP